MIRAYSGTAVRAAEQPLLAAGFGPELMQRAAYGLYAAAVRELLDRCGSVYGTRVCVLAGAGNNGGDALYAGARLARRGAGTTAVLTAPTAHPEALAEFRRQGGRVLALSAGVEEAAGICAAADLVIDGILGTGGRGGLRGPAAELARKLPDPGTGPKPPLIIACDLPSGVDADTGEADGEHLAADLTVTFGAVKTGLMAGPGAVAAGRIEYVDIGLAAFAAPELLRLEPADLAGLLSAPRKTDHKYTRGVLGIAAGSATYPGAAVLATGAALAAGVGMIRYLGPEPVGRLINAVHPEAVCGTGSVPDTHVQAWLAGPGAGADEDQRRRALDAMASGLPAVVDADAVAWAEPGLGPQVILTPHAGELTALLTRLGEPVPRKQVEADPLRSARRAAELTGATVLLKGWATITAAPTGETFSQAEATPWLAAAGSGDTLSGILGALLATDRAGRADERPPPGHYAALAAAAASIHGRAGTLAAASGPVAPSALPAAVRTVIGDLSPAQPAGLGTPVRGRPRRVVKRAV
ncbi:NAD(P)H-hydrate epimerase [Arthrobacter sp. zg-Y820]|uniref:NAD(P)H-hydrate epimerase n=1 Tax=unclassified Arthrobacter TaxID=235627 RepID=UPI001E5191B4|nr:MULTISPECIES: NAD(P)H-hydrate epimerase [unclassified Arthrobacter]MCC9195830.1 NAD(P)H-hydrate epimerase [Arthrobacter sp. zg-Y820]MDK1278690.1 NAD(P)H-hydrate epimerase [Arthrobacter sp. zg.Y820]WIB08881.1 NAD(P)H-hydrate epimerase [Arthrobacter sp. zg-Y820]